MEDFGDEGLIGDACLGCFCLKEVEILWWQGDADEPRLFQGGNSVGLILYEGLGDVAHGTPFVTFV